MQIGNQFQFPEMTFILSGLVAREGFGVGLRLLEGEIEPATQGVGIRGIFRQFHGDDGDPEGEGRLVYLQGRFDERVQLPDSVTALLRGQ